MAIDGLDSGAADVFFRFGDSLCRTTANLMMLGAALIEAMAAIEATKETIYEAEVHRIAGEIALKSPQSGCGESRSVFRARARGCASAASKVLGTPRRDEHGAALARSGQAG